MSLYWSAYHLVPTALCPFFSPLSHFVPLDWVDEQDVSSMLVSAFCTSIAASFTLRPGVLNTDRIYPQHKIMRYALSYNLGYITTFSYDVSRSLHFSHSFSRSLPQFEWSRSGIFISNLVVCHNPSPLDRKPIHKHYRRCWLTCMWANSGRHFASGYKVAVPMLPSSW